MSVKKGDVVKIRYTEKTDKGKVLFSNKDGDPIEVTVGEGDLVKGFEEALIGMEKGDEKKIAVDPEKGYGRRNDERIKTLTKGYRDGGVKKGEEYLHYDFYTKRPIKGTVLEVKPKIFIVDFNHRLCDKTLQYDIEVVGIEKPVSPPSE
ncbi:MAG: FKBP-type peptidyl-prolyl cis-trans isomerase [Spirochaetales bacterium]|nr:FKBP-type peptidyl-prolyl cis-trans isomerase [Spirochaetales bacterium]